MVPDHTIPVYVTHGVVERFGLGEAVVRGLALALQGMPVGTVARANFDLDGELVQTEFIMLLRHQRADGQCTLEMAYQ